MKKFISCMLALVMMLGIMSVGVMAADPVLTETFDTYADKAAAQANWSTVHDIVDDGNGGQAIEVRVANANTFQSTFYKQSLPENVYTISFRVKTDAVTENSRVEFSTNNTARVSAPVTTDWTTVTGTAFLRGSWANGTQTGVKFTFYGVADAVQKYYIDDVVLTPYPGDILEGLNADFEEYSTTEVVGFVKQGSSAAFSADPTAKAAFGYDTGADGTGYSLKIVGAAAVSGVKFTSGVHMPLQELRLTFKLKSTVANVDAVRFEVGGTPVYAQVTAAGTWESKEILVTPTSLSNTGTAMYIRSTANVKSTDAIWVDDLKMTVVANEVEEPVTPPAPTSYAVTINTVEGATTSVAAATSEGEAVNYTVVPQFGYYIAKVMVGNTDVTAAVDAYKGGTYSTGDIEADTAIVVTTASYAANDKGVSTDVATLPAAFGSVESSVTFGKVLDANATSYGVELKTAAGADVLTYHGGGPLYKANSKNANGQYAVEFVGLEAGEYTVRTYVIVDGVKTFGAPATFTVQ